MLGVFVDFKRAFQSEDDILLRDEFDQLAKDHPDQFKIWYTVDRANPGT